MPKLTILTQGNPLLKKKAKAVSRITKEHAKLLADMFETMKAAPGVGLAAPQVGVSERLIVVSAEDKTFLLVNPKIVKKEGNQTCIEGCLSVPGLEGPVERHKKIRVKAQNKSGKQVTIEAEGLLAVVFQHEIDHLDGILFVDRIKDPSLIKLKQVGAPHEAPNKEETI